MTDSQLLLVLLADWLESDAYLPPPSVFAVLSTGASRLVGPFPLPVCFGQLSQLNEAESRKDW